MIRHCARAPTDKWGMPHGYSRNPNDYTSQPWPSFHVPPMECTPRGSKIIENQGKYLRSRLPEPISLVSDVIERDQVTSKYLAKGLGLPNSRIKVCGPLWNPVGYSICPRYSNETLHKSTQYQLDTIQKPANYEEVIDIVQRVIGKGKEKPIRQIPNIIEANGYYTGGMEIVNEALETIILEQGAGLPLGWGRMKKETLYDALSLHIYFDRINNGFEFCRNVYSNYLVRFHKNLREPGTIFYVGHDTDLTCMQMLIGLYWRPHLFPDNATVAGSSLLFDYDNVTEMITTTYLSTDFSSTDGILYSAPAIFQSNGKNKIHFNEYSRLIEKVLDHKCVRENYCA